MPRNSNFTASVLKNTNVIIGTTDSDFSRIREGSFFKFLSDPTFYTIVNTESFFYIKPFEVLEPKKIRIEGNTGINLIKTDTINISYKEYEIQTLIDILDGGRGYKKDDVISISGGSLSQDLASGLVLEPIFKVNEVNEDGQIQQVGLESRGIFIDCPPKQAKVKNGSGAGAILDLEYRILDNRKITDRQIIGVDLKENESNIFLNYSLPPGLKQGKLSCQKWKLFLTGNYLGESRLGEEYELNRDFTSHLGLPLMVRGSLSQEEIFNKAITILDNRIREIEEKLKR